MKMTPEEKQQALAEGWAFSPSGVLMSVPDETGTFIITPTARVLMFLRDKGHTSDFHKRAFMAVPWSYIHHNFLAVEGQSLHDLLKTNLSPKFQEKLNAGDPLYEKALSVLATLKLKGYDL